MTKKLFLGLALLAALVACNKEPVQTVTEENQGKALIIGATLDPLTKMDYTAQEDGSYKATFLTTGTDALYSYFVKVADGKQTVVGGPVKLTMDLTTLSADKRSCNFVAGSAVVPADATHIATFFANGGTSNVYADTVKVDLSLQTDLVDANKHHAIVATSPISAIQETENAYTLSSIALKYQTALVKFELTLPDGVKLPVGSETAVEIEGDGIHNVAKAFAKTADEVGKITAYPVDMDTVKHVLTAYAVLLATDNFANSKIKVVYGEDSYLGDFAPTATLAGGKAYTAARTLVRGAKTKDRWFPDEAGSLDWATSGVTADAEWLTFADNKLSWTENATGKMRTATATDVLGDKYIITQVGANEFKGNWKLTCKIFSKNSFVTAADPGTKTGIVFGNPLRGETLEDVDGKSYTNNLGVTGLYYTAVMDATVDIDYEAKVIRRVGMFLDARNNAQAVSNGVDGYGYACFLPGMGTKDGNTLWAAPWNFVQPDLSNDADKDYTWLWFTVSEDLNTLHYNPNTAATMQTLNTSAATTASQICAITVAVSKSENVTVADVNTNWNVVYQGNAYSGKPGGLLFERVVD